MRKQILKRLDELKRTAPAKFTDLDVAELDEAAANGTLKQYRSFVAMVHYADLKYGIDWCLAFWELLMENLESSRPQRKHLQLRDISSKLVNNALDALRSNNLEVRRFAERLVASDRKQADLKLLANEMLDANLDLLRQYLGLRAFLCGFAHNLWPTADLGWLRVGE